MRQRPSRPASDGTSVLSSTQPGKDPHSPVADAKRSLYTYACWICCARNRQPTEVALVGCHRDVSRPYPDAGNRARMAGARLSPSDSQQHRENAALGVNLFIGAGSPGTHRRN